MADCFAFVNGRCIATSVEVCTGNCTFYKTKGQFRQDFLEAKKILDKRGKTAHYREKYQMFNEMCDAIGGLK